MNPQNNVGTIQKVRLANVTTAELVEELQRRSLHVSVPPYEPYQITVGQHVHQDTGPVVILVVND